MYDFKTMVDRRSQGSVKWKIRQYDSVPLSTADTDFLPAPEITEGLECYVKDMVFGYTSPTDAYYDAIIDWYQRRHHKDLKSDWLFDSSGVLNSINQVISAFTEEGDGILIMEPVYYPFKAIIKRMKREVVISNLILDNNQYTMDFDDLEDKMKRVKLLIFCSPHNPVGRVWTKDELKKLSDLCEAEHVLILSDEIHSDIVMDGFKHTVFSNVNPNSMIASSASKSFNLAGLQTSFLIIENTVQQEIFKKYLESLGLHTLNAVGPKATELAFTKAENWLDAFNQHIKSNHLYLKEMFSKELKQLNVVPLEGTYLQWLDFSKLFHSNDDMKDYLETYLRIDIDPGILFSDKTGLFMRVNIAISRDLLENVCGKIVSSYHQYCQNQKE